MPSFVYFLRCVAKATVKNGGKALASLLPFGEVGYEIATDAWHEYRKNNAESNLRADLEQLAQATQAEVHQVVEEVISQEPAEVRAALMSYLDQMPASIRQSLRRPSDPGGTTVPAGLSLKKPEDLLPFLPTALPRFRPGDRPLAADWELVEMLGKGGFGEVWKARHIHQSRKKPVALKFCLDAVAASTLRNEATLHDHLDRVRDEAATPGIVPLLETYLRADPPCLMYEYIEGGDLAGLIREKHEGGSLTPAFAASTLECLARTIAFVHRLDPPLVHRDLKPSNVLVRKANGEAVSFFVADFGIGSLVADQMLRQQAGQRSLLSQVLPTAVRGAYTALYASPQQVQGEKPDPRDDVHALGVVWYQLITGDLAMLSIPPDWRDVVEERGLASEQAHLLACCLASRAEKRLVDAADLAGRLAAILPSLPGTPATAAIVLPKDEQPRQAPTSFAESQGGEDIPATDGSEGAVGTAVAVAEGVSRDRTDAGDEMASDHEDGLDQTAPGESSGLIIAWTIVGGILGAGAGWFARGLVWAALGGVAGWFFGCGVGLFLGHLKKRRRVTARRLLAKGRNLRKAKKDAEALDLFRRALECDPASTEALLRIASVLLRTEDPNLKDPKLAFDYARRAAEAPGHIRGRSLRLLADILKELSQHGEASAALEQVLESNPDGARTLNGLAWLHATSPDPAIRDGARAVRLAGVACERTGWRKCHMLDTLAAAYAEIGQFDEGVRCQLKALELAPEEKKDDYESRVRLYRLRQPFRVFSLADD